MENYDVIVVGSGHAGCESAHAAAQMGMKTLLLTLNLDSIAFLACNPSIGGSAKGHLVCETDALGGIIGRIADKTTIQLKMLNEAKGPAIQSLRAQVDKVDYHNSMKSYLESVENLRIKQAEVSNILTKNGKIVGVQTSFGEKFKAKSVVIATGVYLKSKIIVGNNFKDAGPAGFQNSKLLTKSISELGIEIRRFKTGTPPRIDKKTIDFSKFEEQCGEQNIPLFSFLSKGNPKNISKCHLGYTSAKTKEVILKNLKKAPMFSGKIKGTGARYCPSIEDKMVRFSEREKHQIFLEPESLHTDEIYIQGLSTSMPVEIQEKIVHSVLGLEHANIMRNAYAIEYDCINPQELLPTLETKKISGLFFAGQMNGTSGYEEAAAQGIVAGINASNNALEKPQIVLSRDNSYIGVLIDDLITKGTNEPYRMMTSRAEHRLFLRQDNADERLTPIGREVGLVDDYRWKMFLKKQKETKKCFEYFEETKISGKILETILNEIGLTKKNNRMSIKELILKGAKIKNIEDKVGKFPFSEIVKAHVCIELKYAGYIKQEKEGIQKQKKFEDYEIPKDFDYMSQKGLRIEAKQKLTKIKPLTIGQASRISGVNPADITVLLLLLKNSNV